MEKDLKEILKSICLNQPVCDMLTTDQYNAIDSMIELLSVCDYETLCNYVKAYMENRCVVFPYAQGTELEYTSSTGKKCTATVAEYSQRNVFFSAMTSFENGDALGHVVSIADLGKTYFVKKVEEK